MFVSRRLRHIIVLLGSDGRIAVLVTILWEEFYGTFTHTLR